jgi:F-type H+-transporting ATPase subunit delta
MHISRVARRYAEAILSALPEGLSREEFFRDVDDLRSSLAQSRELRNFFESPIISSENKTGAIQALFSDRLSPYLLSVLIFLVEKTRERQLAEIIDALIELKRAQDGILFASVASAVPIDEEGRTALEGALRHVSQLLVETEYKIDPSLIGGVKVRMNNVVYDGSVAHHLKELRTRFMIGAS